MRAANLRCATVALLLVTCFLPAANSLSVGRPPFEIRINRRDFVARSMSLLLPTLVTTTTSASAATDPRAITTLRLNSPNEKAGLRLTQVTIGTPPRSVVAVESVAPSGLAAKAGVKEGVILLDYEDAKSVLNKIQNGPYPLQLNFYNLAAGGDAFGDMGKPLVTAKDALEVAKTTSSGQSTSLQDSSTTSNQQQYVMRVLKPPPASCQLQSRRGDVLEISYEARIKSPQGPIYDSSFQRGTGQPYQMVLGSGDMIPGVDKGLYEMCPGEVRELVIPPVLGYGPRASKTFDIPAGSTLYWTVELVSVNSVREGDARDREELEGRAAW